ncbi:MULTISPECIES: AI-2E family transporter [unclassified Nocardioides]|uniref:AI-2E family transporter n=1 Tax=unclassified Nocardioides TaxID=2615069 RepID=UPI003014452A
MSDDPEQPDDQPAEQPEDSRWRRTRRIRPERDDDERLPQRLAHQWAQLREERERALALPETRIVAAGGNGFSTRQVPHGLDLTAAWAWRFIVIVVAAAVVAKAVAFLSVVVLPVVIALLLAALVVPLVDLLNRRLGLPRGLSSLVVVIGFIAAVAALLTLAGQQIASGATDLVDQSAQGIGEIRDWLKDGPLHASDSQINDYLQQAQETLTQQSQGGEIAARVTEVTTAVGHVFAGLFIALFSTYFFLSDGNRIWSWIVRLTPRAARAQVDSSGRVAWISLTQFVRATVVVALVDAIGIAIGAAVLGVPFVLAIGVLVFLGAFVPLIGATVAGIVAVLVALVDQGPVTALLMLAVIIGVQQLEAHVLQPFLMGRWVSIHPLGVIIAIAVGVLVGGVAGALVAVPLAAAVNAVGEHLAANTDPGDDPIEELAEDYEETGETPEIPQEQR